MGSQKSLCIFVCVLLMFFYDTAMHPVLYLHREFVCPILRLLFCMCVCVCKCKSACMLLCMFVFIIVCVCVSARLCVFVCVHAGVLPT